MRTPLVRLGGTLLGTLLSGLVAAQPTVLWERANASVGIDRLPPLRIVRIRPQLVACVGSTVTSAVGQASRVSPYLTLLDQFGTVRATYLLNTTLGSLDFVSDAAYNGDGTLALWGQHSDIDPFTGSPRNSVPFLLVVDTLGTVRWRQPYPQYGPPNQPRAILSTPDGYLLGLDAGGVPAPVPGTYYPIPGLMKVDKQGQVQWRKSYPSRGFAGTASSQELLACRDGSYLLVGTVTLAGSGVSPFRSASYWLVNVTATGDTLRSAAVGHPTEHEEGLDALQTQDGGYVLRGRSIDSAGGSAQTPQGQLVKVDSLFRPQWTRTVGPMLGQALFPGCDLQFVYETIAGQLVAGGRINDHPNGQDEAIMLSINGSTGAVAWTWRRQYATAATSLTQALPEADGSALVVGDADNPANPSSLLFYVARYGNLGVPVAPTRCRYAPQAAFVYATPAPDSLRLVDTSLPGSVHAVIAQWHWEFGDGTTSTLADPRHHYASTPAVGTPVRLTITTNLGCSSNVVQYPG